jgi:SpoVK/Ycf46/Vps4 family AAA+-type ATPase
MSHALDVPRELEHFAARFELAFPDRIERQQIVERVAPRALRRFDEIFFVDLPSADARVNILRLHATRRGLQLDDAALRRLSASCKGFSGAEIEQAIVSACYGAHASQQPVTAELIEREIAATKPLSVVMAERVDELRAWAAERTVAAD